MDTLIRYSLLFISDSSNESTPFLFSIRYGKSDRLVCDAASGQLEPVSWWHDKREVKYKTHKEYKVNVGSDVSVFNVIRAAANDSGLYYAKAGNGTILCEFNVVITDIPSSAWIFWTASGVAFLFVAALLSSFGLTICTRRRLRRRVNKLEIFYKSGGDLNRLDQQRTLAEQAELLPFIEGLEIQRQRIKLCDGQLGIGQFGIVKQGELLPDKRQLACKMPRDPRSFEQIKMLFAELKVLMYAGGHPHIVALVGACTEKMTEGVLIVALELARHGSLKSYLATKRSHYIDHVDDRGRIAQGVTGAAGNCLDTNDLVSMAYQIADGMAYLASKSIVHRDLAARNVLVMDNKIAKVADFGLARQCQTDYMTVEYTRRFGSDKQPFRWMPPECFTEQQHFTEQSDVWSFGVTLWEIFQLGGALPYESVADANELIQGVSDGSLRLIRPRSAPRELFDAAMITCWQHSAESRPTFSQLSTILAEMIPDAIMDELEVHRSEHVTGRQQLESLPTSVEVGSEAGNQLTRRTRCLAALLIGASSIVLLMAATYVSLISGGDHVSSSNGGIGTGE